MPQQPGSLPHVSLSSDRVQSLAHKLRAEFANYRLSRLSVMSSLLNATFSEWEIDFDKFIQASVTGFLWFITTNMLAYSTPWKFKVHFMYCHLCSTVIYWWAYYTEVCPTASTCLNPAMRGAPVANRLRLAQCSKYWLMYLSCSGSSALRSEVLVLVLSDGCLNQGDV